MASSAKSLNFEKALKELEQIVERMEAGDLSLDDSLKSFARGMDLSRQCQRVLDEAEQRIEILSKEDETLAARPYTPDEE